MTTEAKWSDLASMDGAKTFAASSALLPVWVSLALVIVIAWQLAQLFWMLVPAPSSGDVIITPTNVVVDRSNSNLVADADAISKSHVFGEASRADEPQVVAVQSVEVDRDTRLNLELKGTIASDSEENAVAIISDGGKDEKVYSIGDPVSSNSKLHAVYLDRVVLDENGVLTNLKLPKEFAAGVAPNNRAASLSVVDEPTDGPSMQSMVAQNVSKLADVIRPTPYFVDGQQQGYRVYPGRDRTQFAALGLRPGDLIKDIDGQALTDPSQAMQVFQSLGDTDQVSVTVERNGQPEVIILRTSQLDLADETSQ